MSPSSNHRLHAIYFTVLLSISAIYFTYVLPLPSAPLDVLGQHENLLGFLVLLCAAFIIVRILWMLEINMSSSYLSGKKRANSLPRMLLDNLTRYSITQRISDVWRSFSLSSMLWLFLALGYLVWMIFVYLSPQVHEGLSAVQDNILRFLSTRSVDDKTPITAPHTALFTGIARISVIGMLFWITQNLIRSQKSMALLIHYAAALFVVSLIYYLFRTPLALAPPDINHFLWELWRGYGAANIHLMHMMEIVPRDTISPFQQRIFEHGLPAAGLIYGLGGLCGFIFLRSIFSTYSEKYYGFVGLLILLTMMICDFLLVQKPGIFGVWLSGWVCLAALWVKADVRKEKKYRMHIQ